MPLYSPSPLNPSSRPPQAFSNQPILILQDISGNNIYSDLGVLVTAEFVPYVYGYGCTQDWDVSAPYYPCYDAATVSSERVVSAEGVYTFESLKLIGMPRREGHGSIRIKIVRRSPPPPSPNPPAQPPSSKSPEKNFLQLIRRQCTACSSGSCSGCESAVHIEQHLYENGLL